MMAVRLESMAVDAQQRVLLEEALQQQAALHASSTQVSALACSSTMLCYAVYHWQAGLKLYRDWALPTSKHNTARAQPA